MWGPREAIITRQVSKGGPLVFYFHFTNEEDLAQQAQATCLKFHRWQRGPLIPTHLALSSGPWWFKLMAESSSSLKEFCIWRGETERLPMRSYLDIRHTKNYFQDSYFWTVSWLGNSCSPQKCRSQKGNPKGNQYNRHSSHTLGR